MSNYRYTTKNRYRAQTVRKRRRRRIRQLIILGSVLLLLIILISVTVRTVREKRNQQMIQAELSEYADTFQPGVTINGNELTGYSYDEARVMLTERYASNINSKVVLKFGERTWEFSPIQVGAEIDLLTQLDKAWAYGKTGTDDQRLTEIRGLAESPVELSAELSFDESALKTFAESIKREIDCDPVNSTRTVVDSEKFVFTDSAVGYRLDADSLTEQLMSFILNGGDEVIDLQPEIIQPNPSRTELEAMTVLLAECTTSLETSSNARNSNVNRALGYFNFLEVEPGKTISFNKIVGKRTKKNGYSEATEYAGTTVTKGIGGGVCQASTTVYGAVIRAGLEVVERHPHTMTVAYVKASQDAAVTNDDKDLKFKNNTGNTLYFFAWTDPRKEVATVKIYGQPVRSDTWIDVVSEITQTDIYGTKITYQPDTEGTRVWYTDDPPVLLQTGKPGMRSVAYRIYYDLETGAEVDREKLSSDYYAPQDDVYLTGVHPRE